MISLLRPEWPAPNGVAACCTTRTGGVSQGPYASLNLAAHVGDDPVAVGENRRRLVEALKLPAMPRWLQQVHGCEVVEASDGPGCAADAVVSGRPGEVCAVLTADCLPLLLCDRDGSEVGAVHAGWRGLAAGVVEAAVGRMQAPPERLLAWLGPAIGPEAFEVGEEVRGVFLEHDRAAAQAFRRSGGGRWLADLYRLARQRLASLGVAAVYGGTHCSFSEGARFYSYRRDGVTGRMASLIWIEPEKGSE